MTEKHPRLLDAMGVNAIDLARALGLSELVVHSMEFRLVAGEVAELTVGSYVTDEQGEELVKFFQKFNLVSKVPAE